VDLPARVLEKLESLPARPGCYLFRARPRTDEQGGGDVPDAGAPLAQGEVLYVGKAKSLRSRVRSYFQEGGSDARFFVPLLRRAIGDLDTIVTASEKEAAILENALIKQHQPRWNVKLRDDKEFLSLRIDPAQEWPRLDVVRKPQNDGARYYGPYHSATAARRSLHLVNKHFQLRTCSDGELRSRARPCLQHQIKRCPAPCAYEVDRGWYGEQVRAVELFLGGRHDELSRSLKGKMSEAARGLEFELAAIYRDQLKAIEALHMEQRVVQTGAAIDVAQDVIGLHREGDLAQLTVLYVRGGRVSETADFGFRSELADDELVGAFVAQHYAPVAEGGTVPPDEILLPCTPEVLEGTQELLSERRGGKVALLVPIRGPRAHLVAMANENALHSFQQKRRAGDAIEERLEQLRARLRLPTVPRTIECCDISHLGGGDTVGAVVSLVDGEPATKRYKAFHVKGVADGDDYGAMYEVLARRFKRAREQATSQGAGDSPSERVDWNLPDLFVVDGGKGQLAVALKAAHDLGLHELSLAALAKEKERPNAPEGMVVDRVYLPGQKNPIELREHSASMFFLARARDEAHRFANRTREKLGHKRRFQSRLDSLKGVGAELRKELLRKLGSVKAIEAADDATLLAVPGFTRRHLTALRKVFPGPASEAARPDESARMEQAEKEGRSGT
jgi:excinuclease ABC subunit C